MHQTIRGASSALIAGALALMLAVALGALLPGRAFAEGAETAAGAEAEPAVAEGGAPSFVDEPVSADESGEGASSDVSVSAEGEAALKADASFALADFTRAQRGSNREVNGTYLGYAYYQGSTDDYVVAVATGDAVIVHVPSAASGLFDLASEADRADLADCLVALDEAALNGGVTLSRAVPWHFTSETSYTLDGLTYRFSVDAGEGRYYVAVIGEDGTDVVSDDASLRPTHVDFAHLAAPDAVDIVPPATGLALVGEFLSELDWSPLWVSLKTTGVAIVFIFVLGLAAAYFCLRIPKRVQDIADAIFTIPMVLPPTVCGFILLYALGNKSPIGQWLASMNIHLTFSWEATVVAAVVVAFPLMYRSARGAFEGLDPNMLDAARTLGWSNPRIFFKLMIPLSWSSIAAGTVLAFARALGEFGATLFLAGNYAGVTQTLPIAIYFEWMSSNDAAAWFWAGIIIVFSFIVILFINLWGRRTTKYRRKSDS